MYLTTAPLRRSPACGSAAPGYVLGRLPVGSPVTVGADYRDEAGRLKPDHEGEVFVEHYYLDTLAGEVRRVFGFVDVRLIEHR